jgi:hypothetical protein
VLTELALGGREIEREHLDFAAALLPGGRLAFVGDVAVEADAQKCPECAL